MKTVCKKLLCLMLVAMMLVSAVPFAFATEVETALFWIEVRVNGEAKDSKQVTMPVNPDSATVLAYAKLDDVWGSYFTQYADHEVKVEELAAGSAAVNFVKAEVEPEQQAEPEQKPEPKPEENKNPEPKPEQKPEENKKPNNNFDKNKFPGNGHNKPNFNFETVELTVVYNFPDNFRFMGRTSESFKVWKGSDILDALAAAESMGYYEEPTRDGYTMAGYSFDKECTNDVNRDDAINENLTIYCEWERNYTKPGQNNKPGYNYDKNHFPGNGHGKPNFKWETVELTVVYNFPDNFRFMGRTSETFTVWKGSDILDALAAAESMDYYEEPTRDGYTLAGYSFDKECNNDVNRDDAINENLTIYCEWERSYVTLRVYTNGDTRYPDRTFDLSAYAKDGKITQAEVENLLDSKYSAKSGYTLAYYGLFTDKTWDNGDYDNDDAVSSVKVNAFGKTTVYVMVKNVKKSTADSSNPKTGDNIMIAVGTMAMSAAALVSIIELKKRKMI